MALLERVGLLLRANLNDLIDRAEEPEKMVKQVILDMENQLLQVKTQVAIGIADLHLLEKRQAENAQKGDEWMRKAQLAVGKQQDDLARAAIERALDAKKLAESFGEQTGDQKAQVERLKEALRKLETKLAEAKAQSEILLARQRRARTEEKAATGTLTGAASGALQKMSAKAERAEAVVSAGRELESADVEDRLNALEKDDQVERLLTELKHISGGAPELQGGEEKRIALNGNRAARRR